MRTFTLSILIASALPMTALAASCPCEQKTTGEKMSAANAAFLGRMKKVQEVPGTPRMAKITFDVLKSWKGTTESVLDVAFPISVDMCGLPDEKLGQEYIVYAHASTTGELSTSLCDGTDLAEYLKDDLTILDELYHPTYADTRQFPDVPKSHPYAQAIAAFRQDGIVGGHPDGTFRPDWPLSRVEALKIIIEAALPYDRDRNLNSFPGSTRSLPFNDITDHAWYVLYLRKAYAQGLVSGFRDGTFRPEARVTVAEAASIVTKAMHMDTEDDGARWYERYIRAIGERQALPPSFISYQRAITRAELVEMLWRLKNDVRDRDHADAADVLGAECADAMDPVAPNVDMRALQRGWLSMYNNVRDARGLPPYHLSDNLNHTAALWSEKKASQGVMDHKRTARSSYYDYNEIKNWFTDQGLEFRNIGGITFTENIGYGPYRCTMSDCTAILLEAMRQTFDFYVGEESRASRPHFNAIVNPKFEIMGVGVSVKGGQYFVTTHFGTAITSDAPKVCGW